MADDLLAQMAGLRVYPDPTDPERIIVADPAALRLDPPRVTLTDGTDVSNDLLAYKIRFDYGPMRLNLSRISSALMDLGDWPREATLTFTAHFAKRVPPRPRNHRPHRRPHRARRLRR